MRPPTPLPWFHFLAFFSPPFLGPVSQPPLSFSILRHLSPTNSGFLMLSLNKSHSKHEFSCTPSHTALPAAPSKPSLRAPQATRRLRREPWLPEIRCIRRAEEIRCVRYPTRFWLGPARPSLLTERKGGVRGGRPGALGRRPEEQAQLPNNYPIAWGKKARPAQSPQQLPPTITQREGGRGREIVQT